MNGKKTRVAPHRAIAKRGTVGDKLWGVCGIDGGAMKSRDDN